MSKKRKLKSRRIENYRKGGNTKMKKDKNKGRNELVNNKNKSKYNWKEVAVGVSGSIVFYALGEVEVIGVCLLGYDIYKHFKENKNNRKGGKNATDSKNKKKKK